MTKLDADRRDAIASGSSRFPSSARRRFEMPPVRNAIARFNQVEGVTDAERDQAWKHILAAAKKFGVEVHEKSWREVGAKKR